MAAPFVSLFLIILFVYSTFIDCQDVRRRFEYKYSFKGPHLTLQNGEVPFWAVGKDAISSQEQIRITPSLRSKRGWAWCKNVYEHENWEVELSFRVSGRGRMGADGLAFWFTEEVGTDGDVYGSNDLWNGLGVFFDSYDNDNKQNNPVILAVANNGTMAFDHDGDGHSQELGHCQRDFRNKPYPVKTKIEYYMNTLTIWYQSGLSSENDYELCLRMPNVVLPQKGYFGISGATGSLADDHDVISFLTYTLITPTEAKAESIPIDISDMEKEKYSKEFDQYQQKLQKQKEDYRQAHPEKAKIDDIQEDYEELPDREMRQVFEGQGKLMVQMKDLSRKMDEVIGRQERTLSVLNAVNVGQTPDTAPPTGVGKGVESPIARSEIDTLLLQQKDSVNIIREVRSLINDIDSKASSIQRNQQMGGGGPATPTKGSYQLESSLNDINDKMASMQDELRLTTKQSKLSGCPPIPDFPECLSATYFLIVISLQSALFIGYVFYRNSKENSAKKFF